MLKSKIHGATVTEGSLTDEDDITIDVAFLKAASILAFERVHGWRPTLVYVDAAHQFARVPHDIPAGTR